VKFYITKKYIIPSIVSFIVLVVLVAGFFVITRDVHTSFAIVEKQLLQTSARVSILEERLAILTGDTETLKTDVASNDENHAKESELFQEKLGTLTGSINAQETRIKEIVTTTDVSGLVTQWSPFVYRAECSFRKMDSGDMEVSKGSALLQQTSLGTRFITSGHVLKMDVARLIKCTLSAPGSDTEIVIDDSDIVLSEDVDFGYGYISEDVLSMLSSQTCTIKPNIGDAVLILGYPAIGAKESVTATEGIISGFDEEYFTTSAKIERGNSGGAALDIKRNCFLGLPTLVFAGKIESLARILPASSFK
jgi:hypothetical protein